VFPCRRTSTAGSRQNDAKDKSGLTGIALAIFGAVKGRLTGISHGAVGLSDDAGGGSAAGAAFYLALLFAQQ
jgi:hypothetical protein